jgi:hypothetical protein
MGTIYRARREIAMAGTTLEGRSRHKDIFICLLASPPPHW